jgi:uncharacterized membrane protein
LAYCAKCGTGIDADAPYCSKCGAAQRDTGSATPQGVIAAPVGQTESGMSESGLKENQAGALCYVLLWVTGIIFLLIDKRPFVKFHAAQSIVVFGALQVLTWAVEVMFGSHLGGFFGFYRVIELLQLVLWIVLMIKAYQGEKFRVPLAADVAEQLFGKA